MVQASDMHGMATAEAGEGPFRLETISLPRPEALTVELEGIPVESMRLVSGSGAGMYVFGGRDDATENLDCQTAGIRAFNENRGTWRNRSWQVSYPAGAIEDFYMDVHEVSARQYRAFLQADDGWSKQELWSAGATPNPARRVELLERQDDLADDRLPMTGVTWAEAAAYARWVGKRLPSFVEWEYAARGGPTRYRVFAAQPEPGATIDLSRLNVLHDRTSVAGPRPCGWGSDVTSENGIRDLTGNVAEWTATPCIFGPDDVRDAAAHARSHAAAYLDPRREAGWEQASGFWVAGGSFDRERFDFSASRRLPRDGNDGSVGFRCALSLATYHRLLEQPPAGGLRLVVAGQ